LLHHKKILAGYVPAWCVRSCDEVNIQIYQQHSAWCIPVDIIDSGEQTGEKIKATPPFTATLMIYLKAI